MVEFFYGHVFYFGELVGDKRDVAGMAGLAAEGDGRHWNKTLIFSLFKIVRLGRNTFLISASDIIVTAWLAVKACLCCKRWYFVVNLFVVCDMKQTNEF